MALERAEPLALVLAMSDAGVIGKDGGLPWRIPEDMKHFKAVTMGHAVIMGRKTHESIGRPLPGRRNLVVSRRGGWEAPGCEVVGSLEEALRRARESDDEPRVIGGAAIYALALPLATRVFLTQVHRVVDGDTSFEPFDPKAWRVVSRRAAETERDVEFVELERAA
jgi:dihydrofolate reductase